MNGGSWEEPIRKQNAANRPEVLNRAPVDHIPPSVAFIRSIVPDKRRAAGEPGISQLKAYRVGRGCFRPEDPKRRSRDQVARKVKIVVGGGMDAEETLG